MKLRLALFLAVAVWCLMLLAREALSSETCHATSGSGVTIHPTAQPGAVAEVLFENTQFDGDDLDLSCVLFLDGLAVEAGLILGRGAEPDVATLTPPEGFVAVPPDLTLIDGARGVAVIYPADRLMGF